MTPNEDIAALLEKIGFRAEAFDRIRLGRGVIGKVSYVAVAALGVLAIGAFRLSGVPLLIDLVLAAAVFLTLLAAALWFGAKYPAVALLEGSELIQWRQMDMAAKGKLSLPDSPHVPADQIINGKTAETE